LYQFPFLIDLNGQIKINFLGRFENLHEDFTKICEKIGFERTRLKKIGASRHSHYSEYYDEETEHIVAEQVKKDIELFGYKFEKG